MFSQMQKVWSKSVESLKNNYKKKTKRRKNLLPVSLSAQKTVLHLRRRHILTMGQNMQIFTSTTTGVRIIFETSEILI